MKKFLLSLAIIALVVLHQDFWNWRDARPFILGFIPISLFYHACYTLSVSVLMWVMIGHFWPSHLEEEIEREDSEY
ncbi:MAG: hypothetical protein AB1631_12290 [Acidobacteriota bacterium]